MPFRFAQIGRDDRHTLVAVRQLTSSCVHDMLVPALQGVDWKMK